MTAPQRIVTGEALLVGVDHYSDNSIPPLRYCVSDAKALASVFGDDTIDTFGSSHVKLLINGMQSPSDFPTRPNILSAVTSLAQNARDTDTILFYFAGHGVAIGREAYLLPMDAAANVLTQTAVPISLLKRTLSTSQAKTKIVILDACHAGLSFRNRAIQTMTANFQRAIFRDNQGFATLASCKQDEFSSEWDEKQHGVFTYYLVEGLQGAADTDRDNVISISNVNAYTSEKVRQWGIQNRAQQHPTLEAGIAGDPILVRLKLGQRRTVSNDEDLFLAGKQLLPLLEDEDFMGEIGEAVYAFHDRRGEDLAPLAAIEKVTAHLKTNELVKSKLKGYHGARLESKLRDFAVHIVFEMQKRGLGGKSGGGSNR